MLSILTDQSVLTANRVLGGVQTGVEKTMSRLSSGLRVNRASDDAAGMSIAARMESRGRAIDNGMRGVSDLISLIQVADATLSGITESLQRIRELAVQAANGPYGTADRRALDVECQALITSARIAQNGATFNGQRLLDGSLSIRDSPASFDVGMILDLQAVFQPKTTDELFRIAQLSQATTTVTPAGALGAGDVQINGLAVPASVAGSQAGQTAGSAWAVASALGSVSVTGLSVSANVTTVTGASVVPPGGGVINAGDIVINGIAIGAGNYVNAINAKSAQTGVSASVTGGALTLQASDGRNIDVSGAAAFGLGDQTAVGSILITGAVAEAGSANLTIAGSAPANAGLSAGNISTILTGDSTVVPLSESAGYDLNPSLVTAEAATATMELMDRKIGKVLSVRTKLGAIQNALELRAGFLGNAANANAQSRARIVDADFAVETSELVRLQILQTSGLAMIAQANLNPSRILAQLIRLN